MNCGKLFLIIALCAGALLGSPWPTESAGFTVQIMDNAFSPTNLSIAVGDTVTWTNLGINTHSTTSGSGCSSNGLWNSSSLTSGKSFAVTFTNYPAQTYPYFCTPHCVTFNQKATLVITNPATSPPTIAITNPTSGSRFRAPATILLQASTTDTGGTITNVQFFSGGALLATLTVAPYNFTASNLAAGNHSFTAAARDNQGLSATSAVVNVFVLTNALLSAPFLSGPAQFQLTVRGIAGQTYVLEASSNLSGWFPLSTNIASSNVFNVVDSSATGASKRFYRTRQDFQ